MNRFVFIHLFLLFIVSMPAGRTDAGEPPTPVTAKLISNVTAVKPGSSFKAGVLFEIERGWHIYWKNPGDSGLPTTAEFDLPEGFEGGELEWPLPRTFRAEGNVTDYGYEDSLLLVTVIRAPNGLPSNSMIDISAKVSWVSCREICIPGRATLKLDLPVSDTATGANAGLFSEWAAKLPLNASGGKSPFDIEVKTVETGHNEAAVNISFGAGGDDLVGVELYPVPGDSLVVDNIGITSGSGVEETMISFDVKSVAGQKPSPPVMDTLVVFSTSDGRRSGVEVPVLLDKTE